MRALLVYDVNGWAWHNKAMAIAKWAPKSAFESIQIMNIKRFKDESAAAIARADSVHIFGYRQGHRWAEKCSTTVASYFVLGQSRSDRQKILSSYRATAAANQDLCDELKKDIGGKVWCIPNGVDHTVYVPRERKERSEIVVGWAGKPMWTVGPKRVGSYLEYMGMGGLWPDLKNCLQKIPGVAVVEMANLPGDAVSTAAMVDFYNSVDVFICPHYKCGTPNPAFEAAACGCCVITTPCGAFKEVARAGAAILVNGYYGHASDAENVFGVIGEIGETVKGLAGDRGIVRMYGKKARAEIERSWTWEKRVLPWMEMLTRARYK